MARRWSQVEDQLLRRLYADGQPVAELSRRLDRSPDAVVSRRRSLGIRPRRAARPYRPEEDARIRRLFENGAPPADLADRLGRSPDALRLHAQHLGLHRPAPRRRWAEWEDMVLRDGYTNALPYEEIARRLPHRSPTSLAARARRLDLVSYARRWTSLEDERLRRLAARGRTLEDTAQRLGRTPEAIRRRAKRLGIAPPRPAPATRGARRWTTHEDDLLRLHHALNPARMAELLGRSDTAVCRRMCALGLRVSARRSPHHPGGRRAKPGSTDGYPAARRPRDRRIQAEASPAGSARAPRPPVGLLCDPALAARQ